MRLRTGGSLWRSMYARRNCPPSGDRRRHQQRVARGDRLLILHSVTIRTLGEPDCIEATRQLGYVFQLLGDELYLFVDISVLTRRLMCKPKAGDDERSVPGSSAQNAQK